MRCDGTATEAAYPGRGVHTGQVLAVRQGLRRVPAAGAYLGATLRTMRGDEHGGDGGCGVRETVDTHRSQSPEWSLLLEVVSRDIDLTRMHNLYYGHCPKCGTSDDRSLSIMAGDSMFYCHQCNFNGGVFTWLVDVRGMSYRQSVVYLMHGLDPTSNMN